MEEKPLVDSTYLLQKFSGKGGWTYAEIPEILQDKNKPFGWVQVKGFIDDYELKQYKLMPMGDQKLFLPVKAEIRKKIKKNAGDSVHVLLYPDDSIFEIPEEIKDCFAMESAEIYETFLSFRDWEKKVYIDWIYSAKKIETKTNRIVRMMKGIELGRNFNDM